MILFAIIWTVTDYLMYNYYGKYNEMSYRSFQYILTPIFVVAVINFYGWLQGLQWLILLVFGVYDFGYYVIELFTGKEERVFWRGFFKREMNWFGWSPIGWITKNKVKPYQLVLSSMFAIGIVILINVLWQKQ